MAQNRRYVSSEAEAKKGAEALKKQGHHAGYDYDGEKKSWYIWWT